MIADSLESARRSDRIAVLLGLTAVIAAAWVYMLLGAGIEMDTMDMGGGQVMSMSPAWKPRYVALVLVMWLVMMTAMMLPSAIPSIVQLCRFADRRATGMGGLSAALFFASGYLMVWAGFSIAATLIQWALDSLQLLSETMAIRDGIVGALLVVGIGLFQFTPLKKTCLRHCRPPISHVAPDRLWSVPSILRQGMRYGVLCLGCCAVPMGLLFVGGLMNVLAMAAVALWVLVEKVTPWGDRIARFSGAALVASGSVWLAVGLI